MVDRFGLVVDTMTDLRDFQQALAQPAASLQSWSISAQYPSLLELMQCAKPTVLIGVSGQPGLFTEAVIRTMHQHTRQPIIFPLSNPSRQIEAHPAQVIEWTQGDAIVATGSPYHAVNFNGAEVAIAQCNNSYIFPGVGLGVLAVKARIISDDMLMAASNTLANSSPRANGKSEHLLPPLTDIAELSKQIAFNVAKVAQAQGLALEITDEMLKQRIDSMFWLPEYRRYKRVSI
jgi:malate dehydrogenase (oxaloacetate-decarboxylating)